MALVEKLNQIKSETDALLDFANDTTGESDTRLGDAVRRLVDGYGGGGGEPDNLIEGKLGEPGKYSGFDGAIIDDMYLCDPIRLDKSKSYYISMGRNLSDGTVFYNQKLYLVDRNRKLIKAIQLQSNNNSDGSSRIQILTPEYMAQYAGEIFAWVYIKTANINPYFGFNN